MPVAYAPIASVLPLRAAWSALWLLIPALASGHDSVARRWTPAAISTDQYESTPTFTADGREVVFMRSDPRFEHYRLLWSRCVDGAWTVPIPAPFATTGPGVDADPYMTPDGKGLYFISTRQNVAPGDDDFDIWFVARTSDGLWGDATALPEPVNSAGSELLPRMTSDGKLYFGSDRAGGSGQGDIYVATLAAGTWHVSNVGPPVNSSAFEYEAEVSLDGRTMIVVADRGDRSHLYLFRRHEDEWHEEGRIPARSDVFQVGPLLAPNADRLLFAQADNDRSGELFLIDLVPNPDPRWPPRCGP